jgi:hypothetical protein
MKYAPLFLLLVANSAHANGWEWKRQPVSPEEYCEIKRIAKLTPQCKGDLDAIMESERVAMNEQTMMQYNRVLPIPLPLMPTPIVPKPPKSQRGFHKFFH